MQDVVQPAVPALELTLEDPPKVHLEDQIIQLIVDIASVIERTATDSGQDSDVLGSLKFEQSLFVRAIGLRRRQQKLQDEVTDLRQIVEEYGY